MPKITFQETKEFLEKIDSNDNVLIVHHNDGDGFASGIILYDWCVYKGAKVDEVAYSSNASNIDKFQISEYNKVIICDINYVRFNLIADRFSEKQKVFFTDHSRIGDLPEYILVLDETNKGYVPTSKTIYELIETKPWLALSGLIEDSGDIYPENKEFVEEILNKYEMSIEEFKEKVARKITNTILHFKNDYPEAFKLIQKINSIEEISSLEKYSKLIEYEMNNQMISLENNLEIIEDIYFYKYTTESPYAKQIDTKMGIKNENIFCVFEYPRDEKDIVHMTARYQYENADLISLFEKSLMGLEETNIRGYPKAVSIHIKKENVEKFKANLIKNFIQH